MRPKAATTAGSNYFPNLANYAKEYETFSWEEARRLLDGLPDDKGLNIAYEAVDRHAKGPLAGHEALRFLKKDGSTESVRFSDLKLLTDRFANVLDGLGIAKGERVFALLGRIPELFITAIGTLKNRSVFCPMFSAFGPEPIRSRAAIGDAKVLVTTTALYKQKVAGIREQLPALKYVILVGQKAEQASFEQTFHFQTLMDDASDEYEIEPTNEEDMALLHFTSGTTGTPKGAVHVHQAVVAHHITGTLALDLHPDDVFWCTADPGWVTGTSYGIIAPLTNGITSIVDEAEFDAERWYKTLQDQRVTVWYTAPTAIRMLMKAGDELVRKYDLSALRFIASVGEPLNPEAVIWSQKVLGIPFHDNWWQTETGGIMIANYASMKIKPGSMGKPLPGINASVVAESKLGIIEEVAQPGRTGELALRPGFPSLFRGYLNEPDRYKKCFSNGFYLTGDLCRRDEDGYYWFVGRKDDVIKTSGHLIGPFEVESVLLEHPAVAEAGVIGKPDPIAMEVIKAFVSLKPSYPPSDQLRLEILAHARRRLGAIAAPKEVEFTDSLPKTKSGKIMRRLLKAREMGLPEGDISTLEPA